MQAIWNTAGDCPLASDGSPEIVGHIATEAQARRWHDAGFDVNQAADRYRAFIGRWEKAGSEEASWSITDSFFEGEMEIARRAGLDDDADFYRLEVAPKHHEWD